MMGTQTAPERLFYDFCLEDHVPDDHLLRRIDRFLDLRDVLETLKSFYCSIGRPSVDPELCSSWAIAAASARSEGSPKKRASPSVSLVLQARSRRRGPVTAILPTLLMSRLEGLH
jgi:hypothetical protein